MTPDNEKTVRESVYSGRLVIGAPLEGRYALMDCLSVPGSLARLYAKQPRAVADLLLRIAEGGRPRDSITAVAYLMALADGPPAGVSPVRLYDESTYDNVDKDWKVTPRRHWIGKAKLLLNK